MKMFRTRTWGVQAIALVALLLCVAPFVSAQVTTGSLQGVVRDPNGAVVAGSMVKITNVDTGITRETTSNEEGFYRVTNLIPGDNYRVEVTASGFAPIAVEPVRILLATENSADVQLGLAQVGENVQVTVTSEQLINTTQNQLSQSYTPQQLTELPINGSIDNIALLTPGVVTPGDADFTNGVGISANGNRARSNNFQIDGQDNNDNSVAGPALGFTNTEAIGEYQVITNNFSAEFGRNSGAQINTITKSGTNEFHGTLFEFHNNSALDARNNIEKRSQATYEFLASNGFPQFGELAGRFPNPYRSNRFGGSIGGPIVRNKAFFFATYQRDTTRGELISDNLGSSTFTPTAQGAQLAASLFPASQSAQLLLSTSRPGGPAFAQGGGTFLIAPPVLDTDGNGVPDAFAFDATTNFLAPLAIARDGAGALQTIFGGEVVRLRESNSTGDQFISRVDYNLTDKDTLVGRVILDRNIFPLGAGGSTVAGSRFDYRDRTRNVGVTYTRALTSNTINEARFNYSNLFVTFGDTAQDTIPEIAFSGTGNLSGGLNLTFGSDPSFPQSRKVVTYQLQDTISTTIGNHALKLGADVRFQRVNDFFLPFFLGRFTFTGGAAGGTLPADTFFNPNGTPRTTPTAFENFLLGRPRTINFTLGDPESRKEQNDYFFFVQDDWRVRPTLTLNLGLRYEVSTQPLNKLIQQLNAREADPSTALFPSTFALSTRTLQEIPVDKNNFAPRVGFAWSPNLNFLGERFTNGRTVIRGGFGISYDPSFFNIVSNTVTNAPFVARGSFVLTPAQITAGTTPFPFMPSTTTELATTPNTAGGDPRLFNTVFVAPDFHNPYTMSYNFGLQQEVFANSVFEVRYVGSRLVGQFQNVNANPRIDFLNAAGTSLGLGAGAFTNGIIGEARPGTNGNGRVDSDFGRVLMRTNGGTSTYNGLQMRFDTRFRNALTLNVNYSLSKTIDNTSEVFSTLGGGQTSSLAQNPFDISRGERGLSAFHQKHNFTANFLFDLPFYKEQRGLMGKLLGGYQLNGVIRMGSGRPYTPYQFYGNFDPLAEASLRPFNGNAGAGNGTIAFGNTATEFLFGGPVDDEGNFVPSPTGFYVYNTLNPGSGPVAGTTNDARLVYNDFALVQFLGTAAIPALEAFNLYRSPFGDVGRNTFSGLPFYGVNLGVFKTTNLTERMRLEFRAEAFNLLNRRNFGVPDVITEDAFNGFTVGSFQNPGYNLGSSRSVRLGVRFIF